MLKGEYVVKLEIEPCTETDKGSYKLTVKNEKGEVTSSIIEITEIPDEEPAKKKLKVPIYKLLIILSGTPTNI